MDTAAERVDGRFPNQLVSERDLQPVLEIKQGGRNAFFGELGFHGEPGLPVDGHQEIRFSFLRISQEEQLRPDPIPVVKKVAELQEMPGDEILETRSPVDHLGPVPEVKLGLLFDGPDPMTRVGRYPEMIVEHLENRQPTGDGPMADLQVFADGVGRKQRSDPFGQHVAEELHPAKLPDLLDAGDVVPEHPFDFFVVPATKKSRVLSEKGLGKAAEFKERVELGNEGLPREANFLEEIDGAAPPRQLRQGKRMKPIIMVPALKGIPAPPDRVQPGAAGHDELILALELVILALDQRFPAAKLMDFVEDDQVGIPGPAAGHDLPAVRAVVPIEISGRSETFTENFGSERRLPNLAGAADKDHLLLEVLENGPREIPIPQHG